MVTIWLVPMSFHLSNRAGRKECTIFSLYRSPSPANSQSSRQTWMKMVTFAESERKVTFVAGEMYAEDTCMTVSTHIGGILEWVTFLPPM